MASNQRKGTLSFDLSSPLKHGMLLKQGQYHRAFKFRFFVLYPGFLVYYEDQSKWKLDLTRGDTLQSRQGAIKLKNGSTSIARQPPKGCKFGLIVHAPDPQNKRPTYLLNAASKEDRDSWIEAITKGTPHSPKAGRKDDSKTKENSKKADQGPPPPKYTQRQETCDVAAKVAAEAEESNSHEQSITSIDEVLGEPTLTVRRDTSNSAALTLASDKQNSTMDQVLEENEPVTNIDEVLGVADGDNSSEDGSHGDDVPTCNGDNDLSNGSLEVEKDEKEPVETSEQNGLEKTDLGEEKTQEKESESAPEVSQEEPQEPMDSNEKVLSSMNSRGNIEVLTSVTVTVASHDEGVETGGNERGEEDNKPAENGKGETDPKTEDKVEENADGATPETVTQNGVHKDSISSNASSTQSSEVIVPAGEPSNSFSVTVATMDGDSNDSDEDGDGSSISSPPPADLSKNGSVSSDRQSESDSTSEPTTPSITVEMVEDTKQNGAENSSGDEGPKLSPPVNRGRRKSAPFIQKVGYLYKMGGNRKNWKLRYFVLNPGVFFYYKNPKSTKPLGEVKLKNTNIFFPASGERKTSYQFVVHTESQWNKRQDWVIASQSEREMKEWISAFRLASQKPGSPSVSPPGSEEDDL